MATTKELMAATRPGRSVRVERASAELRELLGHLEQHGAAMDVVEWVARVIALLDGDQAAGAAS